jgi:hypothetical protein
MLVPENGCVFRAAGVSKLCDAVEPSPVVPHSPPQPQTNSQVSTLISLYHHHHRYITTISPSLPHRHHCTHLTFLHSLDDWDWLSLLLRLPLLHPLSSCLSQGRTALPSSPTCSEVRSHCTHSNLLLDTATTCSLHRVICALSTSPRRSFCSHLTLRDLYLPHRL